MTTDNPPTIAEIAQALGGWEFGVRRLGMEQDAEAMFRLRVRLTPDLTIRRVSDAPDASPCDPPSVETLAEAIYYARWGRFPTDSRALDQSIDFGGAASPMTFATSVLLALLKGAGS
jgi:hypothetical protein